MPTSRTLFDIAVAARQSANEADEACRIAYARLQAVSKALSTLAHELLPQGQYSDGLYAAERVLNDAWSIPDPEAIRVAERAVAKAKALVAMREQEQNAYSAALGASHEADEAARDARKAYEAVWAER